MCCVCQPEDAADKAKSQYKDVIVGGDVWMIIEEIMTYMRDPMKYHSKRVKLPRVPLFLHTLNSLFFLLAFCSELLDSIVVV